MKKPLLTLVLLGAAALLGVAGWNYLTVYAPVSQAHKKDARNKPVEAWVYHQYGVVPGVLVFDVRSISDEARTLDVTRMLFQSAEALKDKRFTKVLLAYKGTVKFELPGEHFAYVGKVFAYENPVVLVRTLPQHTRNLDGTRAFGTWEGGLLGVVTRELQDVNKMAHQWYLDDYIAARASAIKP